jgi:hypothetical protein
MSKPSAIGAECDSTRTGFRNGFTVEVGGKWQRAFEGAASNSKVYVSPSEHREEFACRERLGPERRTKEHGVDTSIALSPLTVPS